MKHSILFTSSLIGLAASQTANYGQCGGQNWSGSTDCNTGWSCQYQNAWYSQCLPASSSSSAASACSAPTTLTTTTSASSTTTSTSATSGSTGGSLPYAKVTSFVVDGKEGYIAGSNSYWISFLTNNADVDLVMGHLQSSGLKFLRVWGFNDVNSDPGSSKVWFQKLENGQQTINTGFNGLQRLDYVVKSAEAHGIKLIIPFVNYWNDYGGMNAYVNSYGGNLTEWYTNTAAQSAYQNYIKVVVGRYIGSPAIFAWELANEPRCRGCSTDVIYNWAKTTSEFIKTLEPNRMVCIGDEGMGLTTGSDGSYPYTFYEGNDWEKTLTIPTIDFGTFHLYPSQWSEQDSWGSSWVTTHGAACKAAGKPCLFEEYGSDTHSNEAPWQTTAIGSVAADSFWQWGDTLSSGNSPNDNYAIYYGSSDYTTLVTNHVAAINGAA